jgi:hypothetical protein
MAPRRVPLVAGKIISDPRHNDQNIEAVIALAMQKDPTLAPAHADALRKLFDGIRLGCPFKSASENLYISK